MDKILSLEEYKAKHPKSRSHEVRFCSAFHHGREGEPQVVNITCTLKEVDVDEFLKAVQARGGIGHLREDGTFQFIPWPPALVEIRDL